MKKLAILILSLMCLQMSAQITTYNINSTINCTDTLQPFGSHTLSYGLSIDGEGQLLSDSAFIRVVLVDNNGKEWLVYERNSLYATEENNQFQDAAFETAALNNIALSSIIVTLCDASLYLASVKNNCTCNTHPMCNPKPSNSTTCKDGWCVNKPRTWKMWTCKASPRVSIL